MKRYIFIGLVLAALIGGCGQEGAVPGPQNLASKSPEASDKSEAATSDRGLKIMPRHIKSGKAEIKSEDVTADISRIREKTEELGGFVAGSRLEKEESGKTASLTVKVPAESFDTFVAFLETLDIGSLSTETEDVSEKYVDLSARLENARQEEARLLEIMETRAGSLHSVLEVEREISRVREKIERIQGRLRYYEGKTDMSTMEITIRGQAEMAGFAGMGANVSLTFRKSVSVLGLSLQGLAILLCALFPWALLGGAGYIAVKKIRAGRARAV